MVAKVRLGNYVKNSGEQEYCSGVFIEIDGKRYDNVRDAKVMCDYGDMSELTITFTGNVGFLESEVLD